MTFQRWLPLAVLFIAPFASAQSVSCPELPASAAGELSWERVDGPDFTFCKAMRDADGTQAFAVMLGADSSFRARRNLREGDEVVIDGHEVYWHRGEVTNGIVRETLIELARNSTAHIVVRARTEEELADSLRIAGGLQFRDARIGSN